MTIVAKYVVTLTIVTLAFVIKPGCVFACSCVPPGPPLESLANASAVFSGRVTAFSAPAGRGGAEPTVVTFAVTQRWKGSDQATLQIQTPSSSASCGVDFVEGQDYLVYASTSEGKLTTNLCSRTTLLTLATEDLAVLGASTNPTASPGESTPPSTLPATGEHPANMFPYRSIVVSGVLLTTLGTILRRQRRQQASNEV